MREAHGAGSAPREKKREGRPRAGSGPPVSAELRRDVSRAKPGWYHDAARPWTRRRLSISARRCAMATGAPRTALEHAGKNWDASVVERDLYEWWERSGFFTPPEKDAPGGGRPFVMMLPLPNIT